MGGYGQKKCCDNGVAMADSRSTGGTCQCGSDNPSCPSPKAAAGETCSADAECEPNESGTYFGCKGGKCCKYQSQGADECTECDSSGNCAKCKTGYYVSGGRCKSGSGGDGGGPNIPGPPGGTNTGDTNTGSNPGSFGPPGGTKSNSTNNNVSKGIRNQFSWFVGVVAMIAIAIFKTVF
eukprot:g15379.t1